jgi:hypothetical protein
VCDGDFKSGGFGGGSRGFGGDEGGEYVE